MDIQYMCLPHGTLCSITHNQYCSLLWHWKQRCLPNSLNLSPNNVISLTSFHSTGLTSGDWSEVTFMLLEPSWWQIIPEGRIHLKKQQKPQTSWLLGVMSTIVVTNLREPFLRSWHQYEHINTHLIVLGLFYIVWVTKWKLVYLCRYVCAWVYVCMDVWVCKYTHSVTAAN